MSDKKMSPKDSEQANRLAYNDVNATLGVDGFIVGLVGRQIVPVVSQTTVPGDTTTFNFYENFGADLLYSIELVYTDAGQSTLVKITRTA